MTSSPFPSASVITLLASFGLGTVLTGLACRLALRLNWMPRPAPNRLRVTPTAIWGGVAIYLAFLSTCFAKGLLAGPNAVVLMFVGTGVFLIGLIDDLWKLQPHWKLLGQMVLSMALLKFVTSPSVTGIKVLDIFLALLWLVGITNAFNLLDNINGLSAGTAVLVAGFQSVLFLFGADTSRALLCIAFAGATAGFLVFNFPLGRIFMGDSGSQFIGFWLAAITLTGISSTTKNQVGSILFPLMVMVVPICDTTLVTLTRKFRRRPISVGGTDHLSHRLVAYGFSEKGAVLTLWGLSFLSGLVALLTVMYGVPPFLSMVVLLLVAVAVFGVYLTRFELYPRRDPVQGSTRAFRLPLWLGVALGALFDVVLIVAAYYTAYLLRFDGRIRPEDMRLLISSVAELALIKLGVFVALGAYRRWWQYYGLKDAYRVGWASLLASLIAVAYFSAVYRFYGFSRVVFVLDFLLFTLLALLFRSSFRLFDSFAPANHRTNIFIYGADKEGETALHLVAKHYPLRAVGFLDGDNAKKHLMIHSVPVRGGAKDLEALAKRWNVEAVLLTQSTTEDTQNQLRAACSKLGIGLMRLRLELENLEEIPQSLVREPAPKETVLVTAAASGASPKVLS